MSWSSETGFGAPERTRNGPPLFKSYREYFGVEPEGEIVTPEEVAMARERLFPPKEAKEVRPPVDRKRADRIHDSGKADFL